jgi:type I restriction enzyme, S subunit
VDPDYVYQWLLSDSGQARLKGSVAGQAITRLTLHQIKGMQLPVPPRNAQAAIAKVAGMLDRHTLQISASLVAKRRLKRALLQQLLTGSRRLQGSLALWKRVALSDVTHEVSTRNGSRLGPERVMGVLKHEGLVPMRERTMADDLSRYKVVAPSAFAYNPMRINIGSIAYSWHPYEVLVSPDYEVFETRQDRLDPRYLDHLRRSEPWASFVKRAGNGSVRVRIYYQDMGQFVFPLPPLDEQRRIATLLDKADDEIALLERQLGASRQLKRGIMQKLLTGDIAALTESNVASPAPSGSR